MSLPTGAIVAISIISVVIGIQVIVCIVALFFIAAKARRDGVFSRNTNLRDVENNFQELIRRPVEDSLEVLNTRVIAPGSTVRAADTNAVPVVADTIELRYQNTRTLAPLTSAIITMCTCIANRLELYQDREKNCKEIVRWCNSVQEILRSLEAQISRHALLEMQINMIELNSCNEKIHELMKLANEYHSTNQMVNFSLLQKTKSIIEEANWLLINAVSAIRERVSTSSLQVDLQIEPVVDSLIIAMDGEQVQLKKIFEMSMQKKYESIDPEVDQPMTRELLKKINATLEKFEISPADVKRIQNTPIGFGGFSKVYKVEYMGNIRAAKVIQLLGLSMKQIHNVYMRFAKELRILSEIQGPRIVSLHGCTSTLSEITLILEYMSKGCLKTLLKNEFEWRELEPSKRYRILLDAAEGMLFLHDSNVAHRDLKSANILITDDFRAKLTDFGLSKTTDAITSGTASKFMGGTLAWKAPEGFQDGIINGFKADSYSFGIVAWEVLTGVLGEENSEPWKGMSDGQIILAVLNGKRPALPDVCITNMNVQSAKTIAIIMNQCLANDPAIRPDFVEMVVQLHTGEG